MTEQFTDDVRKQSNTHGQFVRTTPHHLLELDSQYVMYVKGVGI